MEVYFYIGLTMWCIEDADVEMEENIKMIILEEMGSITIWKQLRPPFFVFYLNVLVSE